MMGCQKNPRLAEARRGFIFSFFSLRLFYEIPFASVFYFERLLDPCTGNTSAPATCY
jgi:hypothetical protein